jgi:HEPN domain-containing protein
VERLCTRASGFDPDFAEKCKTWAILDGYYVPTRYPNSLPESIPAHVYTQPAAEDAVALAEDAVTFVATKLRPSETQAPENTRPSNEFETS